MLSATDAVEKKCEMACATECYQNDPHMRAYTQNLFLQLVKETGKTRRVKNKTKAKSPRKRQVTREYALSENAKF